MMDHAIVQPAAAWREQASRRFAGLPGDCGNPVDPGIIDTPDFRDWSNSGTTDDQLRIERYLDRHDLRARRILQIGIGSSGLARRLHRRAGEIVGTSIDLPEVAVAQALGYANYSAILRNKYDEPVVLADGSFDFIVDNNPTSSCCCLAHLTRLVAFYEANLSAHGQVVTDRIGLGWIPDDPSRDPRWRFDFDDLAFVGEAFGLSAYRIDDFIYVLSRSRPGRPAIHRTVLAMARWAAVRAKSRCIRLVQRLMRASRPAG